MTEETRAVQDEARERIQAVFRSVEEEFEKLQDQVSEQRKSFEKSTREQVDRLQTELRKLPLYQRAESMRKEANKQIEKNVDQLLGVLNIATRSEVKKLDRKLNQISKKLKELDKAGEEAA